MILEERLGQTLSRRFTTDYGDTADEIISINIVLEDQATLNPTADYVMKSARGVYACLARHVGEYDMFYR